MMNYVLFQGGSGSMAAKAFAHFTALGMINVDSIHAQLCDKDKESADTESAKNVLELVQSVSAQSFLSPAQGNGVCDDKKFATKPLIFHDYRFSDDLARIVKAKTGRDDADLPIRDCVKEQSADQYLLDTFFSADEQVDKIDVGFKGCASRGAVIYSYMLENDCKVLEQIRNVVKVNPTEHIRVMAVGSIFGGTGASMFLKTVEKVKALNPAYVHVAGVLIFPNFGFTAQKNCEIISENFWKKTFTSLNGYAEYPNLVKTSVDDAEGKLDRLYLAVLPNNELHNSTRKVSVGGENQNRKSDFIDVVVANYIADFFNLPVAEGLTSFARGTATNPCSNIYTLNYQPVTAAQKLTLDAIPGGFKEKAAHMLSFSAVVFWLKWCLETKKLKDIVWLQGLLKSKALLIGAYIKNHEGEIRPAVKSVVDTVFNYCSSYVDFVKEITETGKPVETNYPDYSDNYNFFNEINVGRLWSVKNSLAKGGTPCPEEEINAVLGCGDYANFTLGKTARNCIQDSLSGKTLSKNASYADAICAYLNNAYLYLQ